MLPLVFLASRQGPPVCPVCVHRQGRGIIMAAEVSQRLGIGAFRLSALLINNIPCRGPASNGENHGSPLATCNVSSSSSIPGGGPRTCGAAEVRRDPPPGTCEYQPVSRKKEKDPRAHKHSRLRKCERREENNGTSSPIIWATVASQDLLSLDLINPSVYLVRDLNFAQAHHPTSLHLSPGEPPPVPQVSPMAGRMTCWSKRQGPGVLIIATACRPVSTTATRRYTWRGGSSTSDTPPLHRSKTAYYDILNVSPGATQSQIKAAYYKQSFLYHPDKNPGDDEEATHRFSEISEAYTVLGNAGLRRKYDSGALSQSDVQGAWRWSSSSGDTASRPSGPLQQQQQQQRARRFSGKIRFDFDAFFQGHYGEQLQREREMRAMKARKQQLEEQRKEDFAKWKQHMILRLTAGALLTTGCGILISIIKS